MSDEKKKRLSNKDIEKISIGRVMDYLRSKGENPKHQPHGADIVCGNKYIDVKGCLKKATNLRMTRQALKSIREAGKLKQGSFYIYYVFNIASGNPQLMIFDYDTFENTR